MATETGRTLVGTGARGDIFIIARQVNDTSHATVRLTDEYEVRHGAFSMGIFATRNDALRVASGLTKAV